MDEGFIARHGLWDEQQRGAAEKLRDSLRSVDFVRVVFSDLHGLARSKSFTREAFDDVLRNGAGFSSSALLLDLDGNIPPDLLTDGGFGIAELHGSGNFVAVPDPLTYRILPHTSVPTGWVIADEYLRTGEAHPLSTRRLLRDLKEKMGRRGWRSMIGLELEWCLTRHADADSPARPPAVHPVDAGNQLNLEGLNDALAPVLDPLADALRRLDLPLRTLEHESGPGQIEFTFGPLEALEAADAVVLIRAVTKQVCRRLGHHASFMCLPALPGSNTNGWHLHQCLTPTSPGPALFQPDRGDDLLSPAGRHFLGGLLRHAAAGTVFATPTVNGYRRFDARFPYAPSQVTWSSEHRGALVRVIGGADVSATRLETRLGEPNANPYLYLATQISAGLDGIDRGLDPGAELIGSQPGAPELPGDLGSALAACRESRHYRDLLGTPLMTCLDSMKARELERYQASVGGECDPADVSEWEHREYFSWL